MGVSTDVWYQGSKPGVPTVGSDINIRDRHKLPRYSLGTKAECSDGRVYRYSHFGADTNRALVVAQDISESGQTSIDNIVVAPASAQTTTDGTTGQKFLELTLASVTKDEYAGGYLAVTNATGEGYTYQIKGNTATNNPTSGNIRMELWENLVLALDASTDIAIMGSKYQNLEAASASTDNVLAGVTVMDITVSDKSYGWVQTRGPCLVTADTDEPPDTIGDAVSISPDKSTDFGKVVKWGGEPGTSITTTAMLAEISIGTCLMAGTGQVLIDLQLE